MGLFSALALVFLPVLIQAQGLAPAGRMEAGPDWVAAAALPSRMELEDFIRLSILASLSDPATGELEEASSDAAFRARSAYLQALSAAEGIGAAAPDEYEAAAAILETLHEEGILRSYEERQTRLDALFDTGSFNCVSSAVLYMGALKASGIEAEGVQTPDHAFVRVKIGSSWIDAETTTSLGFDPGKRKEAFSDSFGRVTGYAYVPPTLYAKRSVTDERGLIGLILHNRITELERAGRYDLAYGLALDRHALEAAGPDATAILRGTALNWLAAVDNSGRSAEALSLAAAMEARLGMWKELLERRTGIISNHLARLGQEGRWEEGFAFIASARESYGEQASFGDFAMVSLNNRSVELARKGQYKEALNFIARSLAAGRVTDVKAAAALRESMAQALLSEMGKAGTFDEGLEEARELRDAGILAWTSLERGLQALCAPEANRLARADPARGWLAAAAAFGRALAIHPGSALLAQSREQALANQEAAFHNAFAALYNAGRYADAAAGLRQALVLMPGSAALSRDLEAAEKMIR